MMLDLLRRDHLVRTLYWGLPVGTLVGVMAWWMSALASDGPVAATPLGAYLSDPGVARQLNRYLLLAAWVALAFPLIVPALHRCSRLDLTLPMSPRRLWLGHILAVLLSGLTVLLTAAVVAVTALWLRGEAFTSPVDLLGTGLRLVGLPYLLLFVGFGALLSGYALSEDMRPFGAMNLAFMGWNWVLLSVARLRVLDPLPVSRRRLFALVLTPALVASGVGYGVTELIGRQSLDDEPLVGLRRHRSGYYVHVPARFNEIAWAGVAPAVSAPWGESYPAWQAHLVRGLAPTTYAPYHAPKESSLDFVALQLSRGIEKVYGRKIPFEEIRDRYLKVDARGAVLPRDADFRLLEDYPGLAAAPPRGRTLATLLLVGVPLLLSLAFVLRIFRAVVPGTDARRFHMAVGPCFVVLAIGYLAVNIARISQPWIVSGFADILGRQLVGSPLALQLLAWAATLASCTLAYRLARRQYERIQAPAYRDPKQDFLHQLGLGG
jgi:hypothetical protein